MKTILIIGLVCINFLTFSKDIRVGIFDKNDIKQAFIFYNIGRYDFFSEISSYSIISDKKDKIKFIASNNKVIGYLNGKKIGENLWFRLDRRANNNSLLISNGKKKKKYRGNIIVYAINGKLKVVNEINIDDYVEGVIKGEAGYSYDLEYYKVQAVISRTYALHHQKHKEEGFDLCDHTHCQVYSGINYKEEISKAVKATSEEVIVDSSLSFLNTLFHSNCGGQTVTSDFVWSKRLPNMGSVKDTFCTHSSQANWRKTISKKSWINFIAKQTHYSISSLKNKNFNFNQYSRLKNYNFSTKKIKLSLIRKQFKLKSTFFSVHDIGDKIVFIGKGYGHGVGLCQEGGIVMTKTHTYKEVLHFYYQNISILRLSEVEYYRLF